MIFREGNQLLGFAHSQARKEAAVLRVAPFIGLLYSALVLLLAEGVHASALAVQRLRPWYPHKRGPASPASSAPRAAPSMASTFWFH